MITAFQPAAFQVVGFQVEVINPGGYGFDAYDPTRRRDEEHEELAREIAALEEHLGIVSRETNDLPRIRARVRDYSAQVDLLPNRARRAIQHAERVKTTQAFMLADRALKAVEEQEELAMLLALALD